MTPGARVLAAIDILRDVAHDPLPLDRFLDKWARAHRYAGAKDRAAIRDMVYAVMRRRAEFASAMASEEPRALVLAQLALDAGMTLERLHTLFDGQGYAPTVLTAEETARLTLLASGAALPSAADPVRLNTPHWLADAFAFPRRSTRDQELAALSTRAPLDLRTNALKATREKLMSSLRDDGIAVEPCALSRLGVRVDADSHVNVLGLAAYKKGFCDIQDEGFQIASLLADARPKELVLDLCAGGGGKTLALAAAMANSGQIFACDTNAKRLERIKPRLERAGVRNVQLRVLGDWSPTHGEASDNDFADIARGFDRVLVDAPCSGSGAWRRNPDAKWRLTAEDLNRYTALQRRILARAAPLVKPGGTLIYVTCSVLACENHDQIETFCASHPEFTVRSAASVMADIDAIDGPTLVASGADVDPYLVLTPATGGTDGTFVAVLERDGQFVSNAVGTG